MSIEMPPLVTILIPTKNSEEHLRRCLASVCSQAYPNIEVIVIDNHSTDATVTIAKEYGSQVFLKGPERCAQLNLGISKAQGDFIYRVDSDFVLHEGMVAECVNLCIRQRFDAVSTHVRTADMAGFWPAVKRFEREMYFEDSLVAGARFISTDLLRRVGGFDENLIAGEDYDLHNRLLAAGARIGFAQTPEAHLGEEQSITDVWKKSLYYGQSIFLYIRKHPGRAAAQFFPVRRSFLRHWRSFLQRPDLAFGLLVYMLTKYVAAGIGIQIALLGEVMDYLRERGTSSL